MSDMQTTIEAGLNKVAAEFKSAVEKLEGQVQESGKASDELRKEISALAEQYKSIRSRLDEAEKRTADAMQAGGVAKSWGEQFVSSAEYKAAASDGSFRGRVVRRVEGAGVKTVISDGTTVLPAQRQGVIQGAIYPKTVRELIPVIPVSSNALETIRETTWGNSAEEQREALDSDNLPGGKPESEISFLPYVITVRTVAHYVPVSNQLIADSAAIAAYIDMRLRDGLADRVERQLIVGDGVAPNLHGLKPQAGVTISPVNNSLIDTANEYIWTLWQNGFNADAILVNPLDWAEVERSREGTGTGQYLYGPPGTSAPPSLFRVPVIPSRWVPAGEIGVCALRQSTVLLDRQAATVEMGYVNDDFVRNRITLRAEERLALGVDRPGGVAWGDWS